MGRRIVDETSYFFPHICCIVHVPHHHHLAKKKNQKHCSSVSAYLPTSNGGVQNGSSVGICSRCVHGFFCTFGIRFARSVGALINKISASELSQKFIKSTLLDGCLPPPSPPTSKKKVCFCLLLSLFLCSVPLPHPPPVDPRKTQAKKTVWIGRRERERERNKKVLL